MSINSISPSRSNNYIKNMRANNNRQRISKQSHGSDIDQYSPGRYGRPTSLHSNNSDGDPMAPSRQPRELTDLRTDNAAGSGGFAASAGISPMAIFGHYTDRSEENKVFRTGQQIMQSFGQNNINNSSVHNNSSNRGKKSSSSSAATLKATSIHNPQSNSSQNQHQHQHSMSMLQYSKQHKGHKNNVQSAYDDLDEVDPNTHSNQGKSTFPKQSGEMNDLKNFKNAQKQIQVIETSPPRAKNATFTGAARSKPSQQTSSSKKQGIVQQNMQKLINTEGPKILSPNEVQQHAPAKTNPTSMRDKIKMEHPGKKILTPRGNDSQPAKNNTHKRSMHQESDTYSQDIVFAGRQGAVTTGPTSIKHHESISGASAMTSQPKSKVKRQQQQMISTTNLSDIDKKHLGFQPNSFSKKYTNINSSNASGTAGRGVSGSIDLQSGATSMTMIKSKSIHGSKVSEVTVQSNAFKQSNHASSKQQHIANYSTKQGSLLQNMISTPQKFRVKNAPTTHQSGKKSSFHQQQTSHHAGEGPYNNLDNFNQLGASGTKTGSQGNRKTHLLSNNQLSKVTSEKKLMGVQNLSDVGRLSPRDTGKHSSHSKAKAELSKAMLHSTQQVRLTSSTGKKHGNQANKTQSQNSYHLSQPNFMNEYLQKSQKNMKQLQHHQNQLPQQHLQAEVSQSQMMSTSLLPTTTHHQITLNSQYTPNTRGQPTPHKNIPATHSLMHNAINTLDLKKKKRSQGSMKNINATGSVVVNSRIQAAQNMVSGSSGVPKQQRAETIQMHANNANNVNNNAAGMRSHGGSTLGPCGGVISGSGSLVEPMTDIFRHQQQTSVHAVLHPPQNLVVDADSLASNSVHNASDIMPIQRVPQQSQNQHETNLFYKVQDSTLVQENSTYNEIDYIEDDPPASAQHSQKKSRKVYKKQIFAAEGIVASHKASLDEGDQAYTGGNDEDGVPMVEEMQDDRFQFSQPLSPIPDEKGRRLPDNRNTMLDELDNYIEHRNIESNQFDLNIIGGQKTEIYDRSHLLLQSNQQPNLFKKQSSKMIDRSAKVKSLVQSSQPGSEVDNLMIYQAGSGGPNQNFNFAKKTTSSVVVQTSEKSQQSHRPMSSKIANTNSNNSKQQQSTATPTLTCWTGSLQQANYQSSTKMQGASTVKNSTSQQQRQHQQQMLYSSKAQSSQKISTVLHHSTKNNQQQSMQQKEIYKVSGSTKKSKNNASSSLVQQQKQQTNSVDAVGVSKITSSSFDSRPGSQSMSYIPPRKIQDQSLQLIQVPLSRAELNNQSAYHLADSQYGNQNGNSFSAHQKSISYSKDDNGADIISSSNNLTMGTRLGGFNSKSIDKGTPGKNGLQPQQRVVYQTSTTMSKVQQASTLSGLPQQHHQLQQNLHSNSDNNQVVFSRSQSNQQISTTQVSITKRDTNSQSRGKQRTEIHKQSKNSVKQHSTQINNASNHYSNSGKKTGPSQQQQLQQQTSQQQQQQSKLSRKNHNNLKMSTMQLRDQDFKKITSQIQSQTMTNAKKKKMQFSHNGQITNSVGKSGPHGQVIQPSSITPGVSNKQQNQSRLMAPNHESNMSQKMIKTTKIYSPHRRSIQQVSNSNIGAYLNPIDCGAEAQQDSNARDVTGGPGGQYTGSRKFAYSLTDKYQGGLADELVLKQQMQQPGGVYAGSHVSSSDGGASYMIPSENERIMESTHKKKDKLAVTGSSKHGAKGSNASGVASKRGVQGMTSSQSSTIVPQQYPSGNNINMFFPDPNATFLKRKKSSIERGILGHPSVGQSHQSIAKSRGSSKGVEPHRIVKVSKPFQANTLGAKQNETLVGSHKVSPIDNHKKPKMLQQPQPSSMLNTNPNSGYQKKSGSFTGSQKESLSSTLTVQNNPLTSGRAGSFIGHKAAGQKKGATVTAPVSINSTQNQPQIQLDSGCQSPEQPQRKQQVHLKGHGPGSLIANANLIRQSPHQQHGSLQGSFAESKAPSHHHNHNQTQSMAQFTKSVNALRPADQQLMLQQKQQMHSQSNAHLLAGSKSPIKKKTKKLSHKIQQAGYTAELSTATKKILQHNSVPAKETKLVNEVPIQGSTAVFKGKISGEKPGNYATVIQKEPSNFSDMVTPASLELVPQRSSDVPKKQNIQLLRQVHHKQITTASKGKDSGSVQKIMQGVAPNQGKSVSVLVPSAESSAISKEMLFGQQSSILQHSNHQNENSENGPTNLIIHPMASNSFAEKSHSFHHPPQVANSAEKVRRSHAALIIGGGADSSLSERQMVIATPGVRSENQNKLDRSGKKKESKAINVQQNDDGNRAQEVDSDVEISEGISADQTAQDQNSDSKKASFVSQKYNLSQNAKPLNVIEERLESQESVVSDPNLSPRSRIILKIQKKIKFAFLKTGSPPETLTENYKIGKVMGKGAFGKVNLAIHRLSGKFVALKSINKQFMSQEQSKRKVMQEFNILRRTRDHNIVRLYESFETQQHIVFVMEVCGGGDLLTYVRRRRKLKEDTACFLFKQIVTGLAACHAKNVLHRDIKLDNVLLTSQGEVKICDFGVSKLVTPGEKMTEQCGTPAYIAPEVFKNEGYQGFASDVWSAGVVLYAMIFGAVPFKASNMAELHKQVLERQPTYKEEEISKDALDLLQGILTKDPVQRLTTDQILAHKWMSCRKVKQVNVFSEQEKDSIVAEFEYYNKRERDVIVDGEHKVVPTDPFAEQMLSSTQNDDLKNVSTRSIILAPFNSTRSQLDYPDEDNLMQQMMLPRTSVKFSAKVKEIDRQYELNNNADLDNGVYHQDEEETKDENSSLPPGGQPPRPTEERPETRMRSRAHDEASIADSFNQEHLQSQLDELDEGNNSINSAELDEGDITNKAKKLDGSLDTKNKELKVVQQRQTGQSANIKNNNNINNPKRKMLSEWQQMIKGEMSDRGSPPKHSLFDQKIFEEIKGDKNIPDSGDLGPDLLDQSYEQVQVELFDDKQIVKSPLAGKKQTQVNPVNSPAGDKHQKLQNSATQRQTMVIDEGSVGEIEKSGYPKPFVMASLNNDDLNHVTTYYYLLQTHKEY